VLTDWTARTDGGGSSSLVPVADPQPVVARAVSARARALLLAPPSLLLAPSLTQLFADFMDALELEAELPLEAMRRER